MSSGVTVSLIFDSRDGYQTIVAGKCSKVVGMAARKEVAMGKEISKFR